MNTNNNEINEDIKHAGYFMYFFAVLTAFLAWSVDAFYILDTFLCAYLGYRACYKPGKYVMLWISIYYGASIVLSFRGWCCSSWILNKICNHVLACYYDLQSI